jgi:hypothetical protein
LRDAKDALCQVKRPSKPSQAVESLLEISDELVVVPAGAVPSTRFNNKPRVAALVDFLPEVDRGSIMEVGLEWLLAVVPCPMQVSRGLLYFSFIVAIRGWVALIALAIVVPPTPVTSSRGAID